MSEQETTRVLDQSALWFLVLAGIAIGLFFLTRNIAAKDHLTEVRVAARWYAPGERKMASALIESAIDSFRKE